MQALLAAGADANARDEHGLLDTALHRASYWGHVVLVRMLLQHGAAVDRRNRLDYTALHWACVRGEQEVARELLASAADVPPRGLSGLFAGGGLSSAVLSVLSEHNISDAMESLGMATQYTAAVNEADVATLAALLGNAATLTTVVSGRRLSTAEQTAFGSALGRVALAVSTATQLQAAFRSKDPAFAVSAVVAFVGESNTPLGKAVDLAVKAGAQSELMLMQTMSVLLCYVV